jgi:hypothetical protein
MQMAMQKLISTVATGVASYAAGGASVGSGINQRAAGWGGAAGSGGILPAPYMRMPMRAYGSGGITPGVTNGTELWAVGERNHGRKKEGIVPLENNTSIPVILKGGSDGGVINNYYNISATDSASFEEYLSRNRRAVRIAQNKNYREHPGVR